MRELTVKSELNTGQILFLERELGRKFPDFFVEFIRRYAGKSVVENTYYNIHKKYSLNSFCSYRMLFDNIKMFKDEKFSGIWIPFAIDNGGWIYCICLSEPKEGGIFLYQMEMPYKNEEKAFEFVSDSFEKFINGLQSTETPFGAI